MQTAKKFGATITDSDWLPDNSKIISIDAPAGMQWIANGSSYMKLDVFRYQGGTSDDYADAIDRMNYGLAPADEDPHDFEDGES